MGRTLTTDNAKSHLTKAEKSVRKATEEEWRRGALSDYVPMALDDDGMTVFRVIAMAIPDNQLSTVDGYTIEIASDAIARLMEASRAIKDQGMVLTRTTSQGTTEVQNPNIAIYAKYAEIAKRYLVELGCTPSARAKIAADAAKQLARPTGVRAKLNHD